MIEALVYKMSDSLMQISDDFNIKINGTTNMTTIFNANSFAAKGHYHGISSEV